MYPQLQKICREKVYRIKLIGEIRAKYPLHPVPAGPRPAWNTRMGEEFLERSPNFLNYVK